MGGVNFIQRKVIQIVGLKLSTEISHLKFFIQKFYPNFFLSKIYVTYSTLLYQWKLFIYSEVE